MSVLLLSTPGTYRPTRGTDMLRASAGATRGVVTVELVDCDQLDWGKVYPGAVSLTSAGLAASIRYLPDATSENLVVVVWHKSDAGTYYGAGVARAVPSCRHGYKFEDGSTSSCGITESRHRVLGGRLAFDQHPFEPGGAPALQLDPHPGLRWEAASSSGGGDVQAVVASLGPDDEPLVWMTSGYRGRSDWTVTTVHPDGTVRQQPLAEWRRARAAPEVLS